VYTDSVISLKCHVRFAHLHKLCCSLLVCCGLLYDAVSNTTPTVVEVRMTDEWWFDKDFEGGDRCMIQALFRHFPHTPEEYHSYNWGSPIYPISEWGTSRMHFSTTSTRPVTIYFCNLITNDARRMRELNLGLSWQKQCKHWKDSFHQQILLNFKEEVSELLQLDYKFVFVTET